MDLYKNDLYMEDVRRTAELDLPWERFRDNLSKLSIIFSVGNRTKKEPHNNERHVAHCCGVLLYLVMSDWELRKRQALLFLT